MNLLTRFSPAFLLLLAGLALAGCHSPNPWTESFSPVDFRSGYPPVAEARAINVGHVDPQMVYERDFADLTLVGTALWTGYRLDEDRALEQARAVGADLVLVRRRFASTERFTDYDAHARLGHRRSVVVEGKDGRRRRVFTDFGPTFGPRTRTQRLYHFSGVFLRTADVVDVH